ncbi:winged helix-turn-helix domain-containing protein [Vibrio sp. JC009]|uniref:ArsR/SmtB family transcription factor n=1 Tax=Vibrio sp. JC009 TaxID=2912314 RepID=UPI0023B1AA95|nr:winged helix-turn-helix domain-containing protein [Vibrio sp. JC009]WED24994.1 winged helix-turn-helix domain-containing protein [Vibrio sp. JC009]
MSSSCLTGDSRAFVSTKHQLAQETEFAILSKALSHPARVRILKILLTMDNMDACLNSDLVSELGLAQSTVSEHLRILKQAEFITADPIPPRMCYRVNRRKIEAFSDLFSAIYN